MKYLTIWIWFFYSFINIAYGQQQVPFENVTIFNPGQTIESNYNLQNKTLILCTPINILGTTQITWTFKGNKSLAALPICLFMLTSQDPPNSPTVLADAQGKLIVTNLSNVDQGIQCNVISACPPQIPTFHQ